ncbi:hypothetical protein PBI_LUCKY2013_226 [Mycobacterium phage Lucky2013]|uniref:hypothetical protein n=2 Tax=unclassified Omegavirus TaxID=2233782 RepID=UPI0004BE3D47|nr:hypothetical protein N857_gp194 [Mycobacterium phage Wanda]AIE57732.1 hypothetical protein PBI_WANDA_228 [Mycobacterium phage Wanda]ASD53617.1 hypothetical protein PBI_LUCKY2013_226 [Mycobacterium phage Lucky2013]ASZ74302.1 hypothetical protein SEA_SQUINT_227 [Mycobacterium phage Squint]
MTMSTCRVHGAPVESVEHDANRSIAGNHPLNLVRYACGHMEYVRQDRYDIVLDARGNGHAFSHDTGQCAVHVASHDCLSYCLMFGYRDTGIRA